MSDGAHSPGQAGADLEIKEQDRLLPIANVSRIMKCALPENAKIAKDAKETIQECVSEFILFVTSEASDRCQQEKRKTINGEDLVWAMSSLGFENYAEPLRLYLNKYREHQKPGSTVGAGGNNGGGAHMFPPTGVQFRPDDQQGGYPGLYQSF